MWNYDVYGLRLRSDLPIAGLNPAPLPAAPDVLLDTTPFSPELLSRFPGVRGEWEDNVMISKSEEGFAVEYRDGTRFFIARDGVLIRAAWPVESTPEDMATYLLGPLLAYLLRIRGVLSLHASAVVIDGHAALLAAPHGGGKSTTAARFAERGIPVMSDDVAPIRWKDDTPWVVSGYPRLRLWDETAHSLYGHAEALPRLTPTWTKRYLDLQKDERQFGAGEFPLGAIFILGERQAQPSPAVRLQGHDAALRLIANTSMGLHLDAAERVHELDVVARLTGHVPVFLMHAQNDLDRLDEFCDQIVAAVRSAL